jgi:hypothetical protein
MDGFRVNQALTAAELVQFAMKSRILVQYATAFTAKLLLEIPVCSAKAT